MTRTEGARLQDIEGVASSAGLRLRDVTSLSSGVNSDAWLLRTDQGPFALRAMPSDSIRPVTYPSEHELLEALRNSDCRVPRPIADSSHSNWSSSAWKAWSLTEYIPCPPMRRAASAVARDLASIFEVLHTLPVETGYGPVELTERGFVGHASSPSEGLVERFISAPMWPFDPAGSVEHLADWIDVARVHKLGDRIRAASAERPAVLHSDVHRDHVLADQKGLCGLIDFGGAFVGSVAWEFAVVSVFLGRAFRSMVLRHYSARSDDLVELSDILAVCFAVYRLTVERQLGSSKRVLSSLSDAVTHSVAAVT